MTNKTQTTSQLKAYRIGETIYSFRKKRKLSQEQLAERIGVETKTVGRWERGDVDFGRVSLYMVYRVAESLGISLGDLLNGDPLLFLCNKSHII